MTEWKYKDGHFWYTIKEGDPTYGSFLYAFLMDSVLIDPELNCALDNDKIITFSNSKEIQAHGAFPVPSHRELLEKISPVHVGVADIGDGRRVGICLDAEESLRSKSYIMQMTFFDYYNERTGKPVMFSREEKETILNRILANAKAYKLFSFA